MLEVSLTCLLCSPPHNRCRALPDALRAAGALPSPGGLGGRWAAPVKGTELLPWIAGESMDDNWRNTTNKSVLLKRVRRLKVLVFCGRG